MRQPWIHSARIDTAFILAPGLVTAFAVLVFTKLGQGDLTVSLWSWFALVVCIDVAHVYSTLYRTYFDSHERNRLSNWLWLTPLFVWLAGVFLYSFSAIVFWRALAYIAVFHFVRQQYGFVMLYARDERQLPTWCRRLDQFGIYGATLYPLIYWHTHLPREFSWFVDGDFFALPPWLSTPSAWLYGILLAAYLVKECWLRWREQPFNIPRNTLMLTTAASWYVGIVIAQGDLAFTFTNVIAHGIPYLALTCIYMHGKEVREGAARVWFAPRLLILSIGLLILFAYVEEGLWDGLLWREHLALFPGFHYLPHIDTNALLMLLVPLLAVPQLTHYTLDAVIWRLRHHRDWSDTLFWLNRQGSQQ